MARIDGEILIGRPVDVVFDFVADQRKEPTGYDPSARLASSTTMSQADMDGTLTFEPVPAGTRMHRTWDVRPKGAFRLLGAAQRAPRPGHRSQSGPQPHPTMPAWPWPATAWCRAGPRCGETSDQLLYGPGVVTLAGASAAGERPARTGLSPGWTGRVGRMSPPSER
jgi:hypothetical protein